MTIENKIESLSSKLNEVNARLNLMTSMLIGDEIVNQKKAAELLGMSPFRFRKIASQFGNEINGYSRLKLLQHKYRLNINEGL